MIYFDTSVLAAYYIPEERSAEAAAIGAKALYPVVSDLQGGFDIVLALIHLS